MQTLLGLLAGFILISCSCIQPLAGGTASEGEARITGRLMRADNIPAAETMVWIRSVRFPSTAAGLRPAFCDSTVTDNEGCYSFTVKNPDTAALIITAAIDDNNAVSIPIVKNDDRPIDLGTRKMAAAGMVSGRVVSPVGNCGKAVVRVMGTGFGTIPDSITGAFVLSGLPAGMYALQATGMVPARAPVFLNVNFNPGETLSNVTLRFRINVLIVDGISNHDWKRTTQAFLAILGETGLFSTDVSTCPPDGSPASAWDSWRPDFPSYNVVVINVNSGSDFDFTANPWPAAAKASFEAYVNNGGGVVMTHCAGTMDTGWTAFSQMLGLGYRDVAGYQGIYLNSAGSIVTVPPGTGTFAWCASLDSILITVRNQTHPVTKGVPVTWMHSADQISYGLRGPLVNTTILSSAFCPWTGQNEPMEWVVNFGKGRVYVTNLGDVVTTGTTVSLQCAGFQAMFVRGVEWAASGRVTSAIPSDFPKPVRTSLRNNVPQKSPLSNRSLS